VTENDWRFATADNCAIQSPLSDQPKCLSDRVVHGGTGGGGGKRRASEFLFHRHVAGDSVAHDARDSAGRKMRLIFMIKIKVKRIFGRHSPQARAGDNACARAHFVIPRQRRIGDGVARRDDAKLGEAIEPGKLGKMFSGLES